MKKFSRSSFLISFLFLFSVPLQAYVIDIFSFFMTFFSFKLSFASVLGFLLFFSPEWLRDRAWPVWKTQFNEFAESIKKNQEEQFEALRKTRQEHMNELRQSGKKLDEQLKRYGLKFDTVVQQKKGKDEEVSKAIDRLDENIKTTEKELQNKASKNYELILKSFQSYQKEVAQEIENVQKHKEKLENHYTENSLKFSEDIKKSYQCEIQELNGAKEKLQKEHKKIKDKLQQLDASARRTVDKQLKQQQTIEDFSMLFTNFIQLHEKDNKLFNQEFCKLKIVLNQLMEKNDNNKKIVKKKLIPFIGFLKKDAQQINCGVNLLLNMKKSPSVRTICTHKISLPSESPKVFKLGYEKLEMID